MVDFLKTYKNIDKVNDIYVSNILKDNSFLGLLFLLKSAGVGRGELLLSYLIKNAKIIK